MDTGMGLEEESNETDCEYLGTEFIEGKIYLIGVFATLIAILSIVFNSFFTLVFLKKKSIQRSSVFYFGILAVIDAIMAINYLAVMSLPVYMDYYQYVPVYHIFLSYFRIVLAESNCAMFASMLLILLATSERLLRTFEGNTILRLRRFLEKNRPVVSLGCILVAIAYKACVYWEIAVHYKPECDNEFSKYEIVPGPLSMMPDYSFWWMFLTRNVVDRILPFFVLVAMNYIIFMTLKKDYKRQDPKQSLSEKQGLATSSHRRSLRDATRALISIVSMYLMSQSPQVVLTFWETFDKQSLADLPEFYSYLNDILSILTLLSSCLRFPVYCSCNQLIYTSSREVLMDFTTICATKGKQPKVYQPISSDTRLCNNNDTHTPSSEGDVPKVEGAIYNDKLKEWQL